MAMKREFSGFSRPFIGLGAIIAWSALSLQFYLILEKSTTSSWSTIIRFFSYFTILTNILVALCFSFLLSKTGSRSRRFFSNPNVITAVFEFRDRMPLVCRSSAAVCGNCKRNQETGNRNFMIHKIGFEVLKK